MTCRRPPCGNRLRSTPFHRRATHELCALPLDRVTDIGPTTRTECEASRVDRVSSPCLLRLPSVDLPIFFRPLPAAETSTAGTRSLLVPVAPATVAVVTVPVAEASTFIEATTVNVVAPEGSPHPVALERLTAGPNHPQFTSAPDPRDLAAGRDVAGPVDVPGPVSGGNLDADRRTTPSVIVCMTPGSSTCRCAQ
jgi:hypothetical protein